MLKKLFYAVAALAACAAALLCGCYNGGQFTAGSYTTKEGGVESVVIDVSDRAVELSVAETEVATVEYWQSESEYYDITFSEGTLTIRLVLDKTWTDYIGTKPAEEYRQLKVAIPQGVAQVTVKTTNEQLKISGVEAETLAAENNGGNIVVEGSGADAVSLTAKNGNISGSVCGAYEDYAITCNIKKGESNLASKPEGQKKLSLDCNNGDINLSFAG